MSGTLAAAPSDAVEAPPTPRPIFEDVYFVIIPSNSLPEEKEKECVRLLTKNGATQLDLASDDLKTITHIISANSDFPAYHDAIDALINVVTPSWVLFAIDKKKAPNPRTYCPDPGHYFHDIVVSFSNDIPDGDKDAIIGGVQAMGGQYSETMTKLVTHVVALTMDNTKCEIITSKNLKALPILPHWFDDCLKLRRRIVEKPYILPEPEVLKGNSKVRPISWKSSSFDGHRTISPEEDSLKPPPASQEEGPRERSVLRGQKVMLHDDLDISDHLRQTLADIIEENGGGVTESVSEATFLVCHWRDSAEYTSALRAHKDVGNLNWLYQLINHNKYTAPMRRLLHFPYPRGGIPGFANSKITISNYTGEARVFLDSLIKAAGGDFTKNMTPDNNYLITAHLASEKCEAAREWNIELVNHLWLEESYAQGKMLPLTNERYTFFPRRTNLTELVGQTPIDRVALMREIEGEVNEDPSQPNETAAGQATPAAKAPSTIKRRRTVQTPATRRLSDEENMTPGSRGAKDRAISKLHGMVADIAKYEKEKKRVGGVVYGGRKSTDAERVLVELAGRGRKRSVDEAEAGDEEDQDELQAEVSAQKGSPKAKKLKRISRAKKQIMDDDGLQTGRVRSPPRPNYKQSPVLKVMVTGYDEGVRALKPQTFKWQDLNIYMVTDARTGVDVIVAPRVMRTPKFLAGLAHAPAVVTADWLEAMVQQAERLPTGSYAVVDQQWNETNGTTLGEVLDRARDHRARGGMFNGWTIFCTAGVKGGIATFQDLVHANGGQALPWKGVARDVPPRHERGANGNDDETEEEDAGPLGTGDDIYLFSEPTDSSAWKRFKNLAKQQGYRPRIVQSAWMLRLMESQDLDTPMQDEWDLTGES